LARVSIFLIAVVLIAGMVGCDGYTPSQNLEIRTWYDLDDVRDNLEGQHILMNDLDSTTPGYEELASPTANRGKGWDPIGNPDPEYTFAGPGGTFDGQGYEIRDLFINRPHEDFVGLFGVAGEGWHIEDIGVVNATVTGNKYVGGLVGGSTQTDTVHDSYSSGNVTGNKYVGGLVGYSWSTVSNSHSTASVTGSEEVGGLVGYSWGSVSNCYSTGSVTGDDDVGGLVGYNGASGFASTVSDSYSTGNVTGNEHVGGLVGLLKYGIVRDSFWDTETSGQSTSAGGAGKTTAEMKSIATFSVSGAGWNIIAVGGPGERNPGRIWNIVDNVTYPFLSWQP
jgi:hypothetical protein